MKKILVIGQTPPPFGGQALMINRMLEGTYANARLYHLRMAYSKDMDDLGKIRLGKSFHTISIIFRAVYLRLRHNIRVLYYPPSGPSILPMFRDITLLVCIRWMFKSTIFHFHAAGLSDSYLKLPRLARWLFRRAYFNPDIAIQLSSFNPDDAALLSAKSTYFVPNGIEDEYLAMGCPSKPDNSVCRVLFVGLVSESKGVLVLIEAIRILRDSGVRVKVSVVGKFASESFERTVLSQISELGLGDIFDFTGVLVGQAKHEQYLAADIFCFPTFFECESFGLVAVEAMQFQVPVIISRWRGVQSLIDDGNEGFIVPVQDAKAVAEKIALLAANPELRVRMGRIGRERYLQHYSIEMFYQRMDDCFANV